MEGLSESDEDKDTSEEEEEEDEEDEDEGHFERVSRFLVALNGNVKAYRASEAEAMRHQAVLDKVSILLVGGGVEADEELAIALGEEELAFVEDTFAQIASEAGEEPEEGSEEDEDAEEGRLSTKVLLKENMRAGNFGPLAREMEEGEDAVQAAADVEAY